jgi:hypothetical protein
MDDYLAKPVKSKILERMLVQWVKAGRSSPATSSFASRPVSDCSESAEHCDSSDIPTFGIESRIPTDTSDDQSSVSSHDDASDVEERADFPTPRPLVTRNGSHEMGMYPFGIVQPARQLDTNELATQLRADRLIDAAGVSDVPIPADQGPQSLTEANVEKLERQGSGGSTSR